MHLKDTLQPVLQDIDTVKVQLERGASGQATKTLTDSSQYLETQCQLSGWIQSQGPPVCA